MCSKFILTGPPGAGKTAILRHLGHLGFTTIPEAATDVIANSHARGIDEPWTDASFIDLITQMQRDRQLEAQSLPEPQFFDRSPVCTLALAKWLGYPIPKTLDEEIHRLQRDRIYHSEVFFIASLGFIERSDARRISLDDAIRFGELHAEIYRELGFDVRRIEPGSISERAETILRIVLAKGGEA